MQTSDATALNTGDEIAGVNVAVWAKLPEVVRRQMRPAQPPGADPPG
jgi:hypothetical protein